ncbi:hypothetical protein [Methanoplanus limicola]|uniref:Uncharacterized protein n=1 Tax=Methanoplanus limicola DSM 2279 TaxID=937775 RepID=H1Z2F6_9EURY|nr:hypothetical protein [Methanoplanus limicola]EHQ35482.1 hypothetical protein Metlim_1373 [Methanoplanus limicola DSM 2279]
MRCSGGDRRGLNVLACCSALILLLVFVVFPASALNATFFVAENGSSYHASLEIEEASEYRFEKPGVLGEKVPAEYGNVSLYYTNGTEASFEDKGRSIEFEKGNYTVGYDSAIDNHNLQLIFDDRYNISVYLPPVFDVRNPLLGMVSTGGEVISGAEVSENGAGSVDGAGDETLSSTGSGYDGLRIDWVKRTYAEIRFYDSFQEKILMIFGSLWLVVAVVFLVPYMMTRRRKG